ncbi:MAG TPA: NAD-dependent epimerase/dehydratase family protein [Spirochaetia bacterium]|nr:NAD-dependent epimerase/dehydratase family protein [Spirochaetia bacterium]
MITAVTGASGHVGANLVRALLNQGRRVRALVHRDTRAFEGLEIEQVESDLLKPESLKNAFRGAGVVYHLAALITVSKRESRLLRALNVEGVKNVIEACLSCGVRRLVHFSSIHSFSHVPEDEAIDETRALVGPGEGLAYDRTKAESESLLLRAVKTGLDAVILNPTAIIGPYDYKPSYMGRFLLALYAGRIPTLVDGGFNWVDVGDVVRGAISAETLGRSGERYILPGQWLSIRDLARIAERVSGRKMPKTVCPMGLARIGAPFVAALSRVIGGEPLYTSGSLYTLRHHRYVSHEKAARVLGYQPRPIEETLRDTFEWFVQNGYIGSGKAG